MKDLRPLSYFLGVQITRNSEGIQLNQSKYIMDILKRANMDGSKPIPMPTVSQKLGQGYRPPLWDPTLYRSLVRALQYVTLMRFDISFAINQICQFLKSSTEDHHVAVKHILHYLKGTITNNLHFRLGQHCLLRRQLGRLPHRLMLH